MADGEPSRSSLANDPRARAFLYQGLLAAALVALAWMGWRNAVVNMQARGMPMGFGFWDETAGFDINQSLISYSALSTYGRAFWVGLLNTLLVGAICIALATPLGFAVGVARLSPNWLLSQVALVYVELMRNTPLLLQLVVLVQRGAEDAARPAPVAERRRRRLSQQPRPLSAAPDLRRRRVWLVAAALALALCRRAGVRAWARRRQACDRRARAGRACRAAPRRRPADARLFRRAASRSAFRLAQLSGFNLQRRAAALSRNSRR